MILFDENGPTDYKKCNGLVLVSNKFSQKINDFDLIWEEDEKVIIESLLLRNLLFEYLDLSRIVENLIEPFRSYPEITPWLQKKLKDKNLHLFTKDGEITLQEYKSECTILTSKQADTLLNLKIASCEDLEFIFFDQVAQKYVLNYMLLPAEGKASNFFIGGVNVLYKHFFDEINAKINQNLNSIPGLPFNDSQNVFFKTSTLDKFKKGNSSDVVCATSKSKEYFFTLQHIDLKSKFLNCRKIVACKVPCLYPLFLEYVKKNNFSCLKYVGCLKTIQIFNRAK